MSITPNYPPSLSFSSDKAEAQEQHLLGIEELSVETIAHLLELAKAYHAYDRQGKNFSYQDVLSGRYESGISLLPYLPSETLLTGLIIVNLFFENSTRTRASFELAAKKLGASVLNIAPATTSMKKGETLLDMAATLAAMRPHILIIRHPEAGAAHLLADKISASVINAGDGCHEHPTQALVDALSMHLKFNRIAGLHIAICGDIRHSRVARSNLLLLKKMGAHVRLVAPRTLLPTHMKAYNVPIFTDMKSGLEGCDVIMMLRLQTERMQGRFVPTAREYFHFFGLDEAKLAHARPDAVIMHPGPMNRGVEIDGIVADDIDRSIITTQVALGVAVRMACLAYLARQSTMLAGKKTPN